MLRYLNHLCGIKKDGVILWKRRYYCTRGGVLLYKIVTTVTGNQEGRVSPDYIGTGQMTTGYCKADSPNHGHKPYTQTRT